MGKVESFDVRNLVVRRETVNLTGTRQVHLHHLPVVGVASHRDERRARSSGCATSVPPLCDRRARTRVHLDMQVVLPLMPVDAPIKMVSHLGHHSLIFVQDQKGDRRKTRGGGERGAR